MLKGYSPILLFIPLLRVGLTLMTTDLPEEEISGEYPNHITSDMKSQGF